MASRRWSTRRLAHRRPALVPLVVDQNSLGGAVEILELTRPQRPQESGEPKQTQEQRRRHQIDQHGHDDANLRRRAFRVTSNDDEDIATAAINGVANPAMAIGTAPRL